MGVTRFCLQENEEVDHLIIWVRRRSSLPSVICWPSVLPPVVFDLSPRDLRPFPSTPVFMVSFRHTSLGGLRCLGGVTESYSGVNSGSLLLRYSLKISGCLLIHWELGGWHLVVRSAGLFSLSYLWQEIKVRFYRVRVDLPVRFTVPRTQSGSWEVLDRRQEQIPVLNGSRGQWIRERNRGQSDL